MAAYLRGGRFTSNDWDSDDDDEFGESEDYFQTLVPRGAARGVLTVHIKKCTDFKSLSVKRGTQSFLRVSFGEKVKCTCLQPYKDPKSSESKVAIAFNEWKHFSIQIAKEEEKLMDTAHKIIVLELIFFEPDTGIPKLMGKGFVKLLEVLNKDRISMHLELKLSRQVICKLELDLVITYGTFGYGYSHQLRHPKRSMESFVDRSLFLRCPPPLERRDAHYNVLTPRPMPHLDIIGSLLRRETIGPDAQDCIFPPKLMDQLQRRGRLLQLHETLESYDSQADVLLDLEKIIHKRGLQMSTSWRQHRKAKKALNRWKNKAILIPKLLGFVSDNKKESTQGSTMRSALLAAAHKAQGMEAVHEDVEESTTATADPRPNPSTSPPSSSPRPLSPKGLLDPPSPTPLFRPGESLLSAVSVASVSTAQRTDQAQQQQQNEEETVVRGLKSLFLGPEEPPSFSSRDAPTETSPGEAGLSGPATSGGPGVRALERPPQTSSLREGWLEGTGGTQEQMNKAHPSTSTPRKLNLPQSHSPAQSGAGPTPVTAAPKPDLTPPAPVLSTVCWSQNHPPPHVLVHQANTAAPGEDPLKMWLHASSSIPGLSLVISEADLEPIRSNLAFPSGTSSQSPTAAGSTSALTGGHRSKPGRDKLRTQEGTNAPYHRPSHPR